MFVFVIKLLKDGKWVIRRIHSLVRLEFFNEIESGNRSIVQNSLYLSVVTGDFVFVAGSKRIDGENRKANPPGVLVPVLSIGEHPRDVFQRGTEMMNDLSSDNAESERNRVFGVELSKFLSRLLLIVTETTFGAFTEKGDDLGIQIDDALFGPF